MPTYQEFRLEMNSARNPKAQVFWDSVQPKKDPGPIAPEPQNPTFFTAETRAILMSIVRGAVGGAIGYLAGYGLLHMIGVIP